MRVLLLALALCVAGASAFHGPAGARSLARSSPVMAAKKAVKAPPKKPVKAVKKAAPKPKPKPRPAAKAKSPANYGGLIGGTIESGGIYDPINYAAGKDINRLRSVELKHGRICMLATLGILVQEVYSWPNSQGYFDNSNPLATVGTVPIFGLAQIVLVAGIIEYTTGNEWQSGPAGDIGFDPLGLAKNGVNPAYAEAELKHGRLAMIAWTAFIVQTLVTGKGVLANTYSVFGA